MKRILISLLMLFVLSVSLAWAQTTVPPAPAVPAIHGTGSAGTVPLFTGRNTIGNSSSIVELNGAVGIGNPNPGAKLDVMTDFPGGGTTLSLWNFDPSGDVAVDVYSGPATAWVGNMGFIQSDGQGQRFFVLYGGIDTQGNPLNLSLAEHSGNVGIRTANYSNVLTIGQGTGPALADGWDSYSSRRWKTNVQPLDGALDKVNRLNGVSFDWKGTGKHDIGLVAEEVAQVLPEVVSFEKDGQEARSVDYGRLTAVLVEAIKAQQAEIIALKTQVNALTNRSE